MDIRKLLESVLDPVHKHLNTQVFDSNGKIKEDVSDYILENFIEWWTKLKYDQDLIENVIMIGSITGYQYTDSSDIDVNVQVKLDDDEIKELGVLLPNGNLLPNTQHPVNYYLTNNSSAIENADGAYDLLDDKWIKQTDKEDIKIPYSYALEIAKFFMDGLDQRFSEYERDNHELEIYKSYLDNEDLETNKDEIQQKIELKEQEIKADLDAIHVGHKMLRAFRHEAFDEGYEPDFLINIEMIKPNKSINNIVYKLMEQFGYLDKLNKYKELRNQNET